MDSAGLYAPVSKEEGEDVGMLSKRSAGRAVSEGRPRTARSWWKYVALVVGVIAITVPITGYGFSVEMKHRIASAVEDALAKQPTPTVTTTATVTATTTATATVEVAASAAAANIAKVSGHPGDNDRLEEPRLMLSNGTEIQPSNPYAGLRYEMRDCGSNADEARALGCSYDVMMQEWTPNDCIDWPLSEKYLEGGNWTWYADSDAANIYDNVEVALGNHHVVYVDQSYHRHHCIFAWERLVRAMRTQRPMIEKLINYDHFHHCRMNTLKTFEEGAAHVRGVVAPTGFTKCASYDVWLETLPADALAHAEKMLKMFKE